MLCKGVGESIKKRYYPLIWAVVVVVIFLVTPYRYEELGLGVFISVVFGSIVTMALLAGFKSGTKKQ